MTKVISLNFFGTDKGFESCWNLQFWVLFWDLDLEPNMALLAIISILISPKRFGIDSRYWIFYQKMFSDFAFSDVWHWIYYPSFHLRQQKISKDKINRTNVLQLNINDRGIINIWIEELKNTHINLCVHAFAPHLILSWAKFVTLWKGFSSD